MKRLILVLFITSFGCAQTKTNAPSEITMNSTESNPKTDWLPAFAAAFNSGDSKTIASMYAPHATWTMANGAEIAAAELDPALAGAFSQGAGGLEITNVERFAVGEGELVRHDFVFRVGEIEIAGRRTIWTLAGKVERDVWVPSAAADTALTELAKSETAALDALYNTEDGANLAARYATDTTVVLTNGKTFRSGDARAFVEDAASTVSNMRSAVADVFAVGADHVATESQFGATLTIGDDTIPLAGKRLTLWSTESTPWKVVAELSWLEKK